MFEQTFKNIDNVLRTEAGCQNELDYIEQTSWIIFLKYLDDLEADREAAADRARQAEPERVRGIVQRTVPRRVPQRALVHVARPCPRRDRRMASGIQ